ncbi:MAG: hypothetical protein AMXMBFR34_23900 [Myxococcaceae bacterium]
MADTQAARRRVLVIDDDASVCEVLKRALSARGWEVQVATNAEEADDLSILSDWDAVMIDKNLPITTGQQFAERVRTRQANAGIVMMTAEPKSSVDPNLYDTYLPKPFKNLEELAEVVELAVERRRITRQMEAMKDKVSEYSSTPTPIPGKPPES